MKISKKERYLLGIFGTVLVSVLYYQFVFTPQKQRLEELRATKVEKEEEYNVIVETIRTLDERKGRIKGLNQQIIDRSSPFYPEIIQENLIIEIDKLLTDSNLKGTFSFSTIAVGQVEAFPGGVNSNLQTSFDSIVDQYNSNFKEEIEAEQEQQENASNLEDNTTENSTEESSENTNSITSGDATTEQIKVSLNFTGTYTELKDFIRAVNNSERKIVITNISLSGKGTDEEVSGSMNLEFYAIPKIGNTDSEYYRWLLNNTYGKSYPFSASEASGTTIEEMSTNKSTYDFVMLVKPISSDLPTVMLGQANDETNLSYVYSDNKGTESVELVLTEVNGKYYFKYKAGSNTYPLSYNGNGIEFKPSGDEITLSITSTKRTGEDDKSGISLVITNNTNKTLNVKVEGEDSSNPRVNIVSEGAPVKVTNN